jgi:hypothetical protein
LPWLVEKLLDWLIVLAMLARDGVATADLEQD